ncbi:TetR family transcriptional regulator [Rhizohabitans arisaemae]|uniref:TetR/AcrR family transcriptional regulator n=1 Tax=Rhizohabitans arisaemae TaxID=2720610 RepID=UPI0024B0CCB3|nr:TetR family transcriptional regulator [Rhizohabitans arisaemae]
MGAEESTEPGRRGRWRSGLESKQKILDAARARFSADGYEQTTVRAIAADAGVDPSMIHYFFGSKDRLFAAVLNAPGSPREPIATMLADGLDGLGAHIVRRFLQVWDGTDDLEPLMALTRSSVSREESAGMLREFIDKEFAGQIAHRLGGPDAELRAALVSAQLFGLATARYAVRLQPVAQADHEVLVAWLGPIVQSLLTGAAPADAD